MQWLGPGKPFSPHLPAFPKPLDKNGFQPTPCFLSLTWLSLFSHLASLLPVASNLSHEITNINALLFSLLCFIIFSLFPLNHMYIVSVTCSTMCAYTHLNVCWWIHIPNTGHYLVYKNRSHLLYTILPLKYILWKSFWVIWHKANSFFLLIA